MVTNQDLENLHYLKETSRGPRAAGKAILVTNPISWRCLDSLEPSQGCRASALALVTRRDQVRPSPRRGVTQRSAVPEICFEGHV